MASTIEMSVSQNALESVIRRVRNRWRLKLALRGLAIVLGVALVVALFGSWIMERERFDPGAVTWARIFTYVVLTALTIRQSQTRFRQRDAGTGKRVGDRRHALPKLRPGGDANRLDLGGDHLRRRFLREAEIAGSLDHPNIVRGFDCGFDESGVYLVEEYLGGDERIVISEIAERDDVYDTIKDFLGKGK